jgi:hypothetical protein
MAYYSPGRLRPRSNICHVKFLLALQYRWEILLIRLHLKTPIGSDPEHGPVQPSKSRLKTIRREQSWRSTGRR